MSQSNLPAHPSPLVHFGEVLVSGWDHDSDSTLVWQTPGKGAAPLSEWQGLGKGAVGGSVHQKQTSTGQLEGPVPRDARNVAVHAPVAALAAALTAADTRSCSGEACLFYMLMTASLSSPLAGCLAVPPCECRGRTVID